MSTEEYVIGDSGGALLLTWGKDESKQAVVCTKGLEEILTEDGEPITPHCRHRLMEVGVKREPGDSFPYPKTGEPDHDEEYAGKPAVNVKRQFVCPRHGVVDTFNTFVIVEELEALEPLWVE